MHVQQCNVLVSKAIPHCLSIYRDSELDEHIEQEAAVDHQVNDDPYDSWHEDLDKSGLEGSDGGDVAYPEEHDHVPCPADVAIRGEHWYVKVQQDADLVFYHLQ